MMMNNRASVRGDKISRGSTKHRQVVREHHPERLDNIKTHNRSERDIITIVARR
jgi:hypothetical protein